MVRWAEEAGSDVSCFQLPFGHDILGGVKRARRSFRDLRDRGAVRDPRWRAVAASGMAMADGHARLFVRHPALTSLSVLHLLEKRWTCPVSVAMTEDEPSFQFSADDMAALGLLRRGVEPIRVVVMPQRTKVDSRGLALHQTNEPMPFIVGW